MGKKIIFKDAIYQYPNRYAMTDLGGGLYQLDSSPGTITQEGTLLTAANLNAIADEVVFKLNDTSSSTTAYTAELDGIAAYYDGLSVIFKPSNTNTAAATLNINGVSVANIKKVDNTGTKIDLEQNDLVKNRYYTLTHDGTDFVISNPSSDLAEMITAISTIEDRLNTDEAAINTLKGEAVRFTISTGSANAYGVSLADITAYYSGLVVNMVANFANTGVATLQVNNLGTKAIKFDDTDIVAGDIPVNKISTFIYDGVNFNLQPSSNKIAMHLADNTKKFADIEYQTPTIVGTQIQLIRQGSTKTLKFYLNADLSGSITISLDGGSTSAPLNDYDGVQLTSLSKGYVEVVDNTTFFTYAPKGSLKITGQTESTGLIYHDAITKWNLVTVRRYYGFDTLVKLNNPASLPTSYGMAACYSPDDTYLAIGTGNNVSGYLSLYKRSGDTFTKLANPSTMPASNVKNLKFSRNGKYLAFGCDAAGLTIYKVDKTADTFTILSAFSDILGSYVNGVDIIYDTTFIGMAMSGSPYIQIYSIDSANDIFTKVANPTTLPSGTCSSAAFNPDGTYLAIASNSSPYVIIYKRSGTTFTKLSNPGTIPSNAARSVAFSPDGNYLAVAATVGTSNMIIYKINKTNDTFTQVTNPTTMPVGTVYGVTFSPDSQYLAASHGTTPFITVYKITTSTDIFTKVANPATLPTGIGNAVAYANLNPYLTVAHAMTPFETTYKADIQGDYVLPYTGFNDFYVSNYLGFGYAESTDVANATNKKVMLLPIK